MNRPHQSQAGPVGNTDEQASDTPRARPRASLRWAASLAGVGLVVGRESWSERLNTAFEKADDEAWQRLRRAGRLGNPRGKSPVEPETLAATTNNPS